MVYLALLIAVVGLALAWLSFKQNGDLKERIAETNSRIYRLRREKEELQEVTEREIANLRFELLKLKGGLRIAPEMKVGDILTIHPQAQQVLAGFHLGGCSNCSIDGRQSLAEAAAVNGRELEPILVALNTLIDASNGSAPVAPERLKTPNVQLHF
jgi:hypothetical protein